MTNRATEEPVLLKREDMRLRWNQTGGPAFGRLRGSYNGIEGSACLVNILVLPFGQSSPNIRFDAEHVVCQLEGRVEWATEAGTFLLEPQDLLFIPAHVAYRFTNVGRKDAYFLDVAAKAETWPPTITYLD
jgi:mannose-6-phosphate isomerase-like protein (cupin superfamily)